MSVEDFEERLRVEPGRFVISALGKRVEIPFNLFSTDADLFIAEKLGVAPLEAWSLKNQIINNYWPEDLDEVRNLFPKIVGEDDNVKLAVLALCTLKLAEPSERLMGIIVEGSNSSGKSHFSKNILRPLQDLMFEFTRMTGAFLERALAQKNLDRKILYLQEISEAPYQLHLSLSEGKLKIGIVQRENGEFKPIEIEAQGQPFLWATSVEWHGSPDLIHRCVILSMDESEEQTKRVISFESKLAEDLLFSFYLESFSRGAVRLFRHIWDNIPENVFVVIPFIGKLQEHLVVDVNVKLRRDWNKLIALIRGSAILFWKRRRHFKVNVDENGMRIERIVIVADERDLQNVLPLLATSFRQTLTNLSERERKVLDYLARGAEDGGEPMPRTVREIAQATMIPAQSLWHYIIPSLEAKGYVVCDRDKRPMLVSLLKAPKEPHINSDIIHELKALVERFMSLIRIDEGGPSPSPLDMTSLHKISPDWGSFRENKPDSTVTEPATLESSPVSQKEPYPGSFHEVMSCHEIDAITLDYFISFLNSCNGEKKDGEGGGGG